MNIETIQMPKHEAEKRLRAYRSQLHRRADSEYEAARQGYEALAKGFALLDLQDVFRQIVQDEKWIDQQGRPRLAIGRADRPQVHLTWSSGDTQISFDTRRSWRGSTRELLVRVDVGKVHGRMNKAGYNESLSGYALIPMVPADVRAEHHIALNRAHVLWEVEKWSDRALSAAPSVDPYLVEHLAGSLYIVHAAWELTPLERAITRGRAER